MQYNWPKIHQYVLAYEGGYVNHPKDPGGATNFGVTQRVYTAYRKRLGHPFRSVKNITEAEVKAIYHEQYWLKVRGPDLPSGLDLTVYDFGVNSGPARSIKFLQRALGVTDDGVISDVTLAAVEALSTDDVIRVIREINHARLAWLKRLKHWGTFGKGWTRRVMGDRIGDQEGDYGVIDRSIGLTTPTPLSAAPPSFATARPVGVAQRTDGTKEARNALSTVKDVVRDGRAISTAVGVGGLTTVQNVAETDGPLAWGISIALVIAALGGVALVIRELRRD